MARKNISPEKIKGVIIQHAIQGAGTRSIAQSFKIARSTVCSYLKMYNSSDLVHTDVINLPANIVAASVRPRKTLRENDRHGRLIDRLSQYHRRLESENTNLKLLWQEYSQREPSGFKYSQFVAKYHEWRIKNGLAKVKFNKWQIKDIPKETEKALRTWRTSNKKSQWERAVALLDLHKGGQITKISKKIERSCKTIKKWHAVFVEKGLVS